MNLYVICLGFLLCLITSEAKIYFQESFSSEESLAKWINSEHKGKEFGEFVRTNGKFPGDDEHSYGIQTSKDARFYGLSNKFEPFSNKGKDLVIQFSVKHEQDIDCGGGYIKVFDNKLDQKDMHGETPYLIMFGPDICGPGTKKVHAILNYKGNNNLIKKEVRCKDDVFSHVYTFVIKPDNTFEILIDNEKVESGDIEDSWDLLKPKKIKDPEASKPEDWDDRKTIPDPEDTKPEDWEKPEHIADPEATKPEDWDDEMDGEWEPPMIDNPEYKGEWKPKQIDNPEYKGEWVHPEIDNPEYVADSELYKFDEIAAVGFDLWQVKSGTIFDEVIITDSLEEAQEHAKKTFDVIKDEEKKKKEAEDAEEAKRVEEARKKNEDEEPEDDEDLDDIEDEEEPSPHVEL